MKSVYLILLLVACIYAYAVEEFDEDSTDVADRPGGVDDPDSGVDHKRRYRKVAFSTYLSKDLNLGSKQHIKFDKVLLNDGGGYNVHIGTFRAPVSGVYIFTYVIAERSYRQLMVNLVVNGRIINGAVGGAHSTYVHQGTNTAIIRITRGSHVWIETYKGRHIEGDNAKSRYSTFSGFMLYARL